MTTPSENGSPEPEVEVTQQQPPTVVGCKATDLDGADNASPSTVAISPDIGR